jgi:hypothetical protein
MKELQRCQIGMALHEVDALLQRTARLQDMGDGVMRPGIGTIHLQRPARRRLRLDEPVRLLQPEGIAAPGVAVVLIGRQRLLRDRQQLLEPAEIEVVGLQHLHVEHVARVALGERLVRDDRLLHIAAHPRGDGGEPQPLALVRRLQVLRGRADEGRRLLRAVCGLQAEMQDRRPAAEQHVVRLRGLGLEELPHLVAVEQRLLGEVVERGDGVRIVGRDLEPLPVGQHASLLLLAWSDKNASTRAGRRV